MAKYTEKHMTEVMKELMLKRSLDHITVQELTDAAQVNRKTFYFHYHGIGELLASMYTKDFEQALAGRSFTPDTWQEQYLSLLKVLRQEAPYLERIYKSSYAAYFRMKMEQLIKTAVEKFTDAAILFYEEKHQKKLLLTNSQIVYINQYYSTAFFGTLEQWFLSGMKEKDDDFIFNLRLLNKDNMFRTFENMDAYNRGWKTREELSREQ